MHTAILSIDGGGMKGIISAVALTKLETLLQQYSHKSNARIGDYFDLIAGTSSIVGKRGTENFGIAVFKNDKLVF